MKQFVFQRQFSLVVSLCLYTQPIGLCVFKFSELSFISPKTYLSWGDHQCRVLNNRFVSLSFAFFVFSLILPILLSVSRRLFDLLVAYGWFADLNFYPFFATFTLYNNEKCSKLIWKNFCLLKIAIALSNRFSLFTLTFFYVTLEYASLRKNAIVFFVCFLNCILQNYKLPQNKKTVKFKNEFLIFFVNTQSKLYRLCLFL